ncbi:MAG TPA: helix-turn-helix domain-containing protein [Steroidobacteraceae bacterium]|nr:helix-turn-helix domain-containing protein [Steroidobacteraceae bacterium]
MPSQDVLPQDRTYSADELTALSGFPRRTIRYYIQLGLLERPVGETRAAHYGWQHLSRLLRIRELTQQGLSLEQIGRLLNAVVPEVRTDPAPGTISIQSQIHLAPGMALTIDPAIAGLSSEQMRQLAREVLGAYRRLSQHKDEAHHALHEPDVAPGIATAKDSRGER